MVAGGRYTAALRRDAASRLAEPFAWTSSQFHLKWSPYLGKFQVQIHFWPSRCPIATSLRFQPLIQITTPQAWKIVFSQMHPLQSTHAMAILTCNCLVSDVSKTTKTLA